MRGRGCLRSDCFFFVVQVANEFTLRVCHWLCMSTLLWIPVIFCIPLLHCVNAIHLHCTPSPHTFTPSPHTFTPSLTPHTFTPSHLHRKYSWAGYWDDKLSHVAQGARTETQRNEPVSLPSPPSHPFALLLPPSISALLLPPPLLSSLSSPHTSSPSSTVANAHTGFCRVFATLY